MLYYYVFELVRNAVKTEAGEEGKDPAINVADPTNYENVFKPHSALSEYCFSFLCHLYTIKYLGAFMNTRL